MQIDAGATKQAWDYLSSKKQLLIDGKWVDAKSGRTFEVYNPADGKVIAHVPQAGKEDVDAAVRAARLAFDTGPWRRFSAERRAELLDKLADAVEKYADVLAVIDTLDYGAPLRAMRTGNIPNAIEKLRYYAGWATRITGSTVEPLQDGEFHSFTLREPIGAVGLIIPWNGPLPNATGAIAPALAAGCTVVLKPAEQTPLSALFLGALALDVGFPPGVLNIVTGIGSVAGAALAEHHHIDKICFTGSTETGKAIVRAAATNLKRVSLELGGKSPVIVFPDADIDATISASATGIFSNSGQVCVAGTRLYAHERVFEEVVDGIAAKARKMKIGPGMEQGTELGPLVSTVQQKRVNQYISTSIQEGAKAVSGGKTIDREGYFVEPTVLINLESNMQVVQEEIFGPVLCAMSFNDDDIDRIAVEANKTIYGLGARVFTRDLSTAHKIARRLRVGQVRINGATPDMNLPFGGYKQSGWGRERGREGIESFTEIKSVIIKL